MINTLNETHLHRTLKALYASREEGSVTEAKAGQSIADILTPKGDVIEIQTSSLSHLREKTERLLREGRKVTVVYPLITEKRILTRTHGKADRTRRSPRKQNIYGMFRELTGLRSVLLQNNFTLEVLEVTVTEERTATDIPVQSANGRRRFKKNWIKTGKRLDSILRTHVFSSPGDYLRTLPESFLRGPDTEMTLAQIVQELREERADLNSPLMPNDVRIMLWLYERLGLVRRSGKTGNAILYSPSATESRPLQKDFHSDF